MARAYVETGTILDKILERKLQDLRAVDAAAQARMREAAASALPSRDFAAALHRDTVALIAEIKKASPSKGVLIENFDPLALAALYTENGAAAISVLIDQPFFQGHVDYLRSVRAAVELPVLYKEFVISAHQVYEARANHADAVLLIVMALEDGVLHDLHALITDLGMAALVEVHNEADLERALRMGARLIGVNNRDLRTFHEDLETTARLARLLSPDVTLVAESALRSDDDVRRMGQLGAHAVLVGEGLVKSDDMAAAVRRFSSQPRLPQSRAIMEQNADLPAET
ncbi:MAG: indole-3-glycerol phosphate synthase TrpC [Chloroflexi bacterium]|nr:indole-3-glycerol phosphate synthase TrpC [Chloroflexota bacterium]